MYCHANQYRLLTHLERKEDSYLKGKVEERFQQISEERKWHKEG